jgi:hypothetical protein
LIFHQGPLYNRRMKQFDLSEEELTFLDTQLQRTRESLEEARTAIIGDRSLSVEELLRIDPSLVDDINTCDQLIVRIQKEIGERRS